MTRYNHLSDCAPLEKRAAHLADVYAAEVADALMTKQPSIVNDEEFLDSVRVAARQRFLAEREVGLHNDLQSIGPGLTAVVTAEAVAEFSSMAHNAPRRPGTLGPTLVRWLISSGENAEAIERIKGEPISDKEWASFLAANGPLPPNFYPLGAADLYSLKLSAGAYRNVAIGTAAERLIFHTYATFSEGGMVNSYAGFALSVPGIVRIEGRNEGELWQNPTFTPTGEKAVVRN